MNHNDIPNLLTPNLLEQMMAMRVLVVDDSRTLRKLLIRELNLAGITNIHEATNGLEAIDLVRAESFDLMLLDMEMPELDGLDVLKLIKSDPTLSYLPVIIISGGDQFAKTSAICVDGGAKK